PGELGGPPGDLYVRVRVRPHPVFGRRGNDLTVELPVTFTEAALGTKLSVPLPRLDGDGVLTTIKVPPGTDSGKTFRVRGKGAPRRGGRGDLLVTVRIDVPKKLTKRQKELLRELAQLEDTTARERLFAETGGEAA
ncbi:MAG: DnaJ C-terminal domain-containing protein, partial [Nitriliruptorales bacterium]